MCAAAGWLREVAASIAGLSPPPPAAGAPAAACPGGGGVGWAGRGSSGRFREFLPPPLAFGRCAARINKS
eukprot:1160652-Pelagomonas_calceolata.AAC.1